MKLILLSDLHANVTALNSVLADIRAHGQFDSFALLGDLVNYGMRPNETIEIVKGITRPILVNLWGNHEYSLFGGSLERFATDRGRAVLQFTRSILTGSSFRYLEEKMEHSGLSAHMIEGKRYLFIHGSLDDPYWGKLNSETMRDKRYSEFDYIISGHSHIPHYIEFFYDAECPSYRNKKRTVFINPGSIGQPRNHCPNAQYGILDTSTGSYEHRSVQYDIKAEQVLYDSRVDTFYKTRLSLGV